MWWGCLIRIQSFRLWHPLLWPCWCTLCPYYNSESIPLVIKNSLAIKNTCLVFWTKSISLQFWINSFRLIYCEMANLSHWVIDHDCQLLILTLVGESSLLGVQLGMNGSSLSWGVISWPLSDRSWSWAIKSCERYMSSNFFCVWIKYKW